MNSRLAILFAACPLFGWLGSVERDIVAGHWAAPIGGYCWPALGAASILVAAALPAVARLLYSAIEVSGVRHLNLRTRFNVVQAVTETIVTLEKPSPSAWIA